MGLSRAVVLGLVCASVLACSSGEGSEAQGSASGGATAADAGTGGALGVGGAGGTAAGGTGEAGGVGGGGAPSGSGGASAGGAVVGPDAGAGGAAAGSDGGPDGGGPCSNGVVDGDETDKDCGGPACDPCPLLGLCAVGADCASEVCVGGQCQDGCEDGILDGREKDIDCGGGECPGCPGGRPCDVPADCSSGVCLDGVCQIPNCADTLQNGSESDRDCGGRCPGCPNGGRCAFGDDCQSGACLDGICQVATCSDRVRNGGESDADCGGSTLCPRCSAGGACTTASDCDTLYCASSVCTTVACTDRALNGLETDTDCGGRDCPVCADGQACALGTDCASQICDQGVCAVPSCIDGVRNGTESDVDCGGTCPACMPGAFCGGDTDCARAPCENGRCAQICPGRQVMRGYDAQGQIVCESVNAITAATVNQACSAYSGWIDSCNGCTTDPPKWGFASGNGCTVGAGLDNTCSQPDLGGQAVHLFGLNTDGAVNNDDKFHMGLHCTGGAPATSLDPTLCPAGQFATAVTGGTLSCATLSDLAILYMRTSCRIYWGWRDNCNGCSTVPPTKWGSSGDAGCSLGGDVDDTCTAPTLGSEVVNLYGLSTDGGVDDNDTFYTGLHCTGAATSAGNHPSGSCPPGEFVTRVRADGSVDCQNAGFLLQNYVRSGCHLYYGWRDSCNGCTTTPSKWGRVSGAACENGVGDNVCVTATLGTESVLLFGLNTDGGVNNDDKFFTGMRCD